MRHLVLAAALLVVAACAPQPQPQPSTARVFGEVTAVGESTITIHEMRFLEGEAAESAYKAETGRDGGPPNLFWMTDLGRDRDLEASPDLSATVLTWNAAGDVVPKATDLAGLRIARDSGQVAGDFYWLDLRDGVVVRIEAQVVP